MRMAREFALANSLDESVKTGSVVVKGNMIVGQGANGSDYHKNNGCERVKRNMPTGTGYELCEGCHPMNHSEPRAIANAQERGFDLNGAELFLWGHWWTCEPCWSAIENAGITHVYLLEGSEKLFNKSHPDNILGRWES
jgi:deoxycytidylate deaminase